MEKELSAYEELLLAGNEKIFKYFSDKSLFKSQFKYSDINDSCFHSMCQVDSDSAKKDLKTLYNEVDGLCSLCKECRDYYLCPRNNSVKDKDVELGRILEDVLIDFLRSECDLNVVHGDDENKRYPDCKLVDKNGEPIAYFEVKYHGAPFINAWNKIGRPCYDSATVDLIKFIKQLDVIRKEIEVPVFLLHWIDFPCIKGIFYESSQSAEEELKSLQGRFERKERSGDYQNNHKVGYTKKFYSDILKMNTFEDFLDYLKDIEKCDFWLKKSGFSA